MLNRPSLERLVERLRSLAAGRDHRCDTCDRTYDHRPRTCHACGSPITVD